MSNFNMVCFMGLGYIGLPTAAVVADSGLKVIGVDINENVVDTINKGHIHIIENGLGELVKSVVSRGLMKASLSPEVSDVYIVVVPTPFKGNYCPDISYVEAATKKIIPILKEGDLYILESTSPVGTTEKMADLIFTERPDLKDKIYIAHCPERVIPGNVLYELRHNDRVIGGIDSKSTEKCAKFYETFVNGRLHMTDSKTAEMCKLTENSSRDVQIAFANELSIICDKAGINVGELISLANKHPRVNILQPGCGVGGHCIAVDPYFITADFPLEAQMIAKARSVNNYKPLWCIEKIVSTVESYKKENNKMPRIALMGLSFKPDIDDLRESPAVNIVKDIFMRYQDYCLIVEPNLKNYKDYELIDYQFAYDNSDICVFLVAHSVFKKIGRCSNKIELDFCGVFGY